MTTLSENTQNSTDLPHPAPNTEQTTNININEGIFL